MTGYRLPSPAATGVSTRKDDDWRAEARCAEVDPELFFPRPGDRRLDAQRLICGACPVRQQCLEQALLEEDGQQYIYGIRGGLSANERRKIIAAGRRKEQAA